MQLLAVSRSPSRRHSRNRLPLRGRHWGTTHTICKPSRSLQTEGSSPAQLDLTWHDAHLSLHLVQLGGILGHLSVGQQGMPGEPQAF